MSPTTSTSSPSASPPTPRRVRPPSVTCFVTPARHAAIKELGDGNVSTGLQRVIDAHWACSCTTLRQRVADLEAELFRAQRDRDEAQKAAQFLLEPRQPQPNIMQRLLSRMAVRGVA